ncbi:MAG: hypothetical protein M1838_001537 [Thelocarpon superellum]|nr:MAG: hypothetical protein M1838_001537 [Thelocarpon superellum]
MAGAVRQPIDTASLEAYIEKQVPEIQTPIDVKQFGFGQSNPTYQLTARNGNKYVMRKKPPGQLLSKTAHQVEREYRIIHALEQTDVPVPKAYCLCEDAGVVGTPFYIMEFLDGRIFEDASFPGVRPSERTEMWNDAIRTLAKLHRIPPASVGLSDFGKASGFYSRQIKTFKSISLSQAASIDVDTQQAVGKIPHFDDMVSFFSAPATAPPDRGTLIHGDYKIDNLVYHRTEPRVIGILDWEMSTVGHPLSDLSNLLTPYLTAPSPTRTAMPTPPRPSVAFTPHTTPGLPTRDALLRLYGAIADWDPVSNGLAWADAFAMFRGAVIMQGIAARYARRQASSAHAREHGELMHPFAEYGWGLVTYMKGELDREGRAKL